MASLRAKEAFDKKDEPETSADEAAGEDETAKDDL